MERWESYAADRDFGRNRLLMPHHQEVLYDFISFFSACPSDAKILDIGCGSGFFLVILREMGFSFLKGIDISEVNVTKAIKKNIDCIVSDITRKVVGNNFNTYFDFIIIMDILEHLADPEAAVKNVRETFASEVSTFFITVPIYNSFTEKIIRLIRRISRLDQAQRHDPTHLHGFSHDGFLEVIQRAGLRIKDTRRLHCPLPGTSSMRANTLVNHLLPDCLRGMFLRVTAKVE